MKTLEDINVPVYFDEGYNYIRISDIRDEDDKEMLEKFMEGQTRPLPYVDDTTIWDAVYIWDYLNFLSAKEGGFVLWD